MARGFQGISSILDDEALDVGLVASSAGFSAGFSADFSPASSSSSRSGISSFMAVREIDWVDGAGQEL